MLLLISPVRDGAHLINGTVKLATFWSSNIDLRMCCTQRVAHAMRTTSAVMSTMRETAAACSIAVVVVGALRSWQPGHSIVLVRAVSSKSNATSSELRDRATVGSVLECEDVYCLSSSMVREHATVPD